MFYGGLNPNYSLENMLDDFKKIIFLKKMLLLLGVEGASFIKISTIFFKTFIDSKYPKFKDIRVYSNSIIYNKLIHKYLDEKKLYSLLQRTQVRKKLLKK